MACGQPVGATTATDDARLTRLAAAAPAPLAEKIRAAHIDGERKTVTVLFADVVGSTALAEQMDPEEWTLIMNRAFERLSPAIYRYEGTIARLMGDAILAFFGAPVTHEDDPVRAIRASLDLLAAARTYAAEIARERGIEFAVRVGLNTGTVVVGAVGSDLKYEYTAMGDAVNLAARLQTAADPDTLLIAENTRRGAAPFFEFEDRGRISVKGRAEPVQVYRVIRQRDGVVQARGIEGLSSPLVGRDAELRKVRGALVELCRGRGQIVSVIGEAGLGKSRLVAELRAAPMPGVSAQPQLRWLEGRSLSYETNTPYAPFIDVFSSLMDVRPDQTDGEKFDRIKTAIAQLAPDRAEDIAPFVASLLEVRLTGADAERVRFLEPPQLRRRLFDAVIHLTEHMALSQPLVLAFDDLHWIDPTSLDLIEQLLPVTDRAMLMILALFRPRREELSWRFHETAARDHSQRYTSIMLEPLDADRSRELVANLLKIDDLPEYVRALILKKTEGNPFFVEEVIRSLLDSRLVVYEEGHWHATREIERIAVPDSLAGVISARLDQLDDDTKRVAQTAAVIGREFQSDVLETVHASPVQLDGALRHLQQRELIREKNRLPTLAYQFKHVLTQETAYASILLSRRRDLHRRVADCLELLHAQRVNDIARHLVEAKELARALPYLVEAGDHAARAYSIPEAMGYYRQALELLDHVHEVDLARRAYEGLGGALVLSGDFVGATEHFQAMLAYGEAQADIPIQVSALNKSSQALMWQGRMEEAEHNLLRAEDLSRQHEDQAGLAEMFTIRCQVCSLAGDFPAVAKYMGESIELGRRLNIKEQMAYGLTHMTGALTNMTRFAEARATAVEAMQIIELTGALQHKVELLMVPIPIHHMLDGDLDAARAAAEEGLALSQRIGHILGECVCAFMLAYLAQLRGDYERAIAFGERSLEASRQTGLGMLQVYPLGVLGSVYQDISPALLSKIDEYHLQALGLLNSPMGVPAGGFAWADLGFCLLTKGDVDRASAILHKGLSTPTQMGLINRSRFRVGLAFVALAKGHLEEAAMHVDQARAYVDERRMRYLYPEVALAQGRVSAARGEPDAALEYFARAETAALEMTMRPMVWQARVEVARELSALGRASEAEAKRQQAREMIDTIVGLFEDKELRELFAANAAQRVAPERPG